MTQIVIKSLGTAAIYIAGGIPKNFINDSVVMSYIFGLNRESKKGSPEGEPACVTSCPAKALKIVHEDPPQEDVSGYDVNLAPPMPKTPSRKPGTPTAKEPPASKS
jgi:Fe-S-cluster-containing dehydrogenase component